MAELVDALDSKSGYRKVVQVRFLFWALFLVLSKPLRTLKAAIADSLAAFYFSPILYFRLLFVILHDLYGGLLRSLKKDSGSILIKML
jgi:hypothetical protein